MGHMKAYIATTEVTRTTKTVSSNIQANRVNLGQVSSVDFRTVHSLTLILNVDLITRNAGNVLVAVGENVGDLSRSVAALCGVDFDAWGSRVMDHFSPVESELLGESGGSG